MDQQRPQPCLARVQVSRRLASTPPAGPERAKRLHLEELEQRLAPDGPFDFGFGGGIAKTAGWGC
jgi:hypothetical protein